MHPPLAFLTFRHGVVIATVLKDDAGAGVYGLVFNNADRWYAAKRLLLRLPFTLRTGGPRC